MREIEPFPKSKASRRRVPKQSNDNTLIGNNLIATAKLRQAKTEAPRLTCSIQRQPRIT